MSCSIHINRNGQSHGPYQEETAREHLASGALKDTDLAWRNDAEGWKPLGEMLAASPAVPAVAADESMIRINRGGEEIGPYTREKATEYFVAGQLLPTDWGLPNGAPDWKPLPEVLNLPTTASPMALNRPQPRMGLAILGGLVGGCIGVVVWVLIVVVTGFELGVVALGVGVLAGLGARIGHGRVPRQGFQLSVVAAVTGGGFAFLAQYLVAALVLIGVETEMKAVIQDKHNGRELSGPEYQWEMNLQLREAGIESDLTGVELEGVSLFSFGSILMFMYSVSGLYILLWTALAAAAGRNLAEREISWLQPRQSAG